MLNFSTTKKDSVAEVFGMETKKHQKLSIALAKAVSASIFKPDPEIVDGAVAYLKCGSKTEVLRKFIEINDLETDYGLDIDSSNGTFLLGFAFMDALHKVQQFKEMATGHEIKKVIKSLGEEKSLKEMLEELEKL